MRRKSNREGVTKLECSLTLPGRERVTWKAQAAHLTALEQGVHFGAVFLLPDDPAAHASRQIMAEYCSDRAADMARWNVE